VKLLTGIIAIAALPYLLFNIKQNIEEIRSISVNFSRENRTEKADIKAKIRLPKKQNFAPKIDAKKLKLLRTALAESKKDSGAYNDEVAIRQIFVEFPKEFYRLKVGQDYELQLFDTTKVAFRVRKREDYEEGKYHLFCEVPNVKYARVALVFFPEGVVAGNVVIPGNNPINIMSVGDGVHRISERRIAKRKMPEAYKKSRSNGEQNE